MPQKRTVPGPMSWLSFEDLDLQAARYDALVARTPGVDRFCTSTFWTGPARAAFAPDAEPFIYAGEHGTIAMMIINSADGARVATPLEAAWGLAAPFAGRSPKILAEQLEWMLDHCARPPEALFLSGIEQGGPWMTAFATRFHGRFQLGLGPVCERRSSPVHGSLDGYLATRSSKFRAELRRSIRKAEARGLSYDVRRPTGEAEALELLDRAMEVEASSWKGLAHEGVNEGAPLAFYRLMVCRLAERGALRFIFGRLGDQDIAFVFGGVFGDTFRGLQMSYRAEHRSLAPGNLMQAAMIRQLASEGVPIYDLGTEMPYKSRWAAPSLETVTLALLPHRGPT